MRNQDTTLAVATNAAAVRNLAARLERNGYVGDGLGMSRDDRWVETERGLARCPRCGPSAVAS